MITNGFRKEDLPALISKARNDGSGLEYGQALRFLELAADDDLQLSVDPKLWEEAQRLAPLVRELHSLTSAAV